MNISKSDQIWVEVIADPEIGGYTAHIPDLPAFGEGETKEAAISDLKEAVSLFVEEVGLENAIQRIKLPDTDRLIMSVSDFALA